MYMCVLFGGLMLSPAQAHPKKDALDSRIGSDSNVRVIYIGRGNPDSDLKESLSIQMGPTGALFGNGPSFEASDATISKWLEPHVKKGKQIVIVLAVSDPANTALKAVSSSVMRLRKIVPKELKLQVFVRDDD